jgi:hypothetical protein
MALTTSLLFQGTLGGRHLEAWEITGDGSTATFNPRLACVDNAWIQSQTGVTCSFRVSISAGIITLYQSNGAGFLENGKKYYVFLLGSA